MKILASLKSKTRLAALAAAVVTLLQMQGTLHLTPEQLQSILVLLGAGGVLGLRDAIEKKTGK